MHTLNRSAMHPPPESGAGWFISFEGIDGAGKSSHIGAVAERMRASGYQVVLTREPGGTPLAEKLRALLLSEPMDPLTEALLMFAARREHLATVIEPALNRSEVVISDRFTDATFAYQGGGRKFDWTVLQHLEEMVQARPDGRGLRQPDLTLWFDLPPEVAAQRLAGAREPDKFESESALFFSRVRAGYARRAAEQPARFVRIEANAPLAEVAQGVQSALDAWLAGQANQAAAAMPAANKVGQ